MKNLLKNILPPILAKLIQKKPKYGFFGNYKTWQEAQADSIGYDSSVILEKVKNSLLKVKNGEVAYERDSVLFGKVEYSWPVLAGLLWTASQKENTLKVLDFGGSLGSSYFQNLNFFKHLKNIRWNIVEQNNFVKCGKEFFEDDNLKFYPSIEDCLFANEIDVLLASSSIQYLEDPYSFLHKIIDSNFEYIIIDRTPFLKNEDRITIQKVNPKIYNAVYPAWLLNENKFIKIIEGRYERIADWESYFGTIKLKGFILKKIK
ncbi:MAG: hypothetical protein UR23_C0008G0003 [Candidatus Roizmanbacteria bacterium GW2011_GWA2_32_13]|uniref:Methyltransferase, TIGR04325 family n=1 Tax=Candidatus Roizmanbacteria bacterium GW2011_GWA2_32_13 TaxID=1618475 RepID=A0A0G0BDV5_9BACT|nr:MAG: hypothetical protein UR23_C0008G0003 [Candidatus Roizmanbacteria bacterium GW2011_GWA2_32_13]